MDVTRTNFEEVYDDIVRDVENCEFMSVDCEFTGLNQDKKFDGAFFDTLDERYMKLHQGSLDFLIIQFGLCTFKYDEDSDRYEARPYNLYVFTQTPHMPASHTRIPDHRFLCQSSSLCFLAKQGFDFNKVFYEGVPYLTQQQEQVIKDTILCKNDEDNLDASVNYKSPQGTPHAKSIHVPDELKDFIQEVCLSIDDLVENPSKGSVNLAPCNSFRRKLIFETVKDKYSSLLHLEKKTNEAGELYIEVSLAESEEDLRRKRRAVQDAKLESLNRAVGLSRLLRVISQSGKTIVGHNMLLDLVHILHQFFLPLPAEFSDFKAAAHCVFPRILDTKLMASTHPFKDLISYTELNALHDRLLMKPFTQPKIFIPEGLSKYHTQKCQHEAGYDAYITGVILVTLKLYLSSFQKNTHISVNSALMQPFLNKIHLMNVCDTPYINLVGDDLNPSRNHVFHVTFPQIWKTHDIRNLFSQYGNVKICYINDTSAYVGLGKKSYAPLVMKTLCGTEAGVFRVTPWSKHTSHASTYSINRKRAGARSSELLDSGKRRKSLNARASPFVTSTPVSTASPTPAAPPRGDDTTSPASPSHTPSSASPGETARPLDETSSSGSSLTPQLSDDEQSGKNNKMFVEPTEW